MRIRDIGKITTTKPEKLKMDFQNVSLTWHFPSKIYSTVLVSMFTFRIFTDFHPWIGITNPFKKKHELFFFVVRRWTQNFRGKKFNHLIFLPGSTTTFRKPGGKVKSVDSKGVHVEHKEWIDQLLTQPMANRLKLFGVTYLVGKINCPHQDPTFKLFGNPWGRLF